MATSGIGLDQDQNQNQYQGLPLTVNTIITLVTEWNDSAKGTILPARELPVDDSVNDSFEVLLARAAKRYAQVAEATADRVEADTKTRLEKIVQCLRAPAVISALMAALNFPNSPPDFDATLFLKQLTMILSYVHQPLTDLLLDTDLPHQLHRPVSNLFDWLLNSNKYYKELKFLSGDNARLILASNNLGLIDKISAASCVLELEENQWFSFVVNLDDYAGMHQSILSILRHSGFNLLSTLNDSSAAFRALTCVVASRDILSFLSTDRSVDQLKMTLKTIDNKNTSQEYRDVAHGNKEFIRFLLSSLRNEYAQHVEHTGLGEDNHRMIIKRDFLANIVEKLDLLWDGTSTSTSAQPFTLFSVFAATYIPWYLDQKGHEKAQNKVSEIWQKLGKEGPYSVLSQDEQVALFISLSREDAESIIKTSEQPNKKADPFVWWLKELIDGKTLFKMLGRLSFDLRRIIFSGAEGELPESALGLLSADGVCSKSARSPSITGNDRASTPGLEGSGVAGFFSRRTTLTGSEASEEEEHDIEDVRNALAASKAVYDKRRPSILGADSTGDRRTLIKKSVLNFVINNLIALWDGSFKSTQPPLIKLMVDTYVQTKSAILAKYNLLVNAENISRKNAVVNPAIAAFMKNNPGKHIPDYSDLEYEKFESADVSLAQLNELFKNSGVGEKADLPLDWFAEEALASKGAAGEMTKVLLLLPMRIRQEIFRDTSIDLETLNVSTLHAHKDGARRMSALSAVAPPVESNSSSSSSSSSSSNSNSNSSSR